MTSRPDPDQAAAAPPASSSHVSPCDQQLMALLRTLSAAEREIIYLLIARWASLDARAGISLIHPRRIASLLLLFLPALVA